MSYTDMDELSRGASTFMKALRTIGMDPAVLVMVPKDEWHILLSAAGREANWNDEPVLMFNGITFMRGT